ncbi:MAG: gliding motility-associated C-terminal domain-containing protein [Cyclobacteriaceae bacterium]|nr:gliding motility-associated C-terminal domain-containing protein [Cyclobacteriaceae bacterium]
MKLNIRHILSWMIISAIPALMHSLVAQPWSPGFTAVSTTGCAPFTVTIIDQSNAPFDEVRTYNFTYIDENNRGSDTNDTVFTYVNPGQYKIIQTVANAIPRTDTLTITVLDPQAPDFLIAICNPQSVSVFPMASQYNGLFVEWGQAGQSDQFASNAFATYSYGASGTYNLSIKGLADPAAGPMSDANEHCLVVNRNITLTDQPANASLGDVRVIQSDDAEGIIEVAYTKSPDALFIIEVAQNGTGNFTIVDTLLNNEVNGMYRMENLNTLDNFYCFRISVADPCNNTLQAFNTVCSVQLEGQSDNEENILNWNTAMPGVQSYEIYRDGILAGTRGPGTTTFTDNDVVCGINYCYQIVAVGTQGVSSFSNTFCLRTTSGAAPPPVENISASVAGNTIVLNWPSPIPSADLVFSIFRRTAQSGFSPYGQSENLIFEDAGQNPGTLRYFYRISYTDLCGNASGVGIIASPVLLRAFQDGRLEWSSYEGWSQGLLLYEVEIYDVQGNYLESIEVGQNLNWQALQEDFTNQELLIRIAVVPVDNALPTVFSNFVRLRFEPQIQFPNAFTPNGDGLNDIFIYESKFIAEIDFRVFSRWGELLFQTDLPGEGWDGNIQGRPAPSGTYIFSAEWVDEAGRKFFRRGEITLIR